MEDLHRDVLTYSYKHNMAHIPSALSMLEYIIVLFCADEEFIKKDDIFVIGKPFGVQAYYMAWGHIGWLDPNEDLNHILKHEEIDFVDFAEETIGNSLGVATGMALANPNKNVWVNITDATLQMGNTLEAILLIGSLNINNILVTVDYNGSQVTGETNDIVSVEPIKRMFNNAGWNTLICKEGNDPIKINTVLRKWKVKDGQVDTDRSTVIFFYTEKAHGVTFMQKNLKEWHYKQLSEEHII